MSEERPEAVEFTWRGKSYPIEKAYSGRTGCMCGCRGKWRYGAAVRQVVARAARLVAKGASVEFVEDLGFFVDAGGDKIYGLYLNE